MQGNRQTSFQSFVLFPRLEQDWNSLDKANCAKRCGVAKGMKVNMNWQAKKVPAEMLALNDKLLIHSIFAMEI